MEHCVFCMIARGDLDARVVYEDEYLIAFDDIAPQARVHTLVIPKAHYEHIGDDLPADEMARLFLAVPVVAKIKGVDQSGYRLIVNTGRDAAQSVHHIHVHILGGQSFAERMVPDGGE